MPEQIDLRNEADSSGTARRDYRFDIVPGERIRIDNLGPPRELILIAELDGQDIDPFLWKSLADETQAVGQFGRFRCCDVKASHWKR
jgi:hypothetical protein